MVIEHPARRQRALRIMLVVMATVLMLLLFVACERLGVVNIISGSPAETARTFLQNLSEGEADYGWHLLHPAMVNDVSKEEYVKAVQTSNVTPFTFEVQRILRDEVYLAQANMQIEFTQPIEQLEQWPSVLDCALTGKFLKKEDGLSTFVGSIYMVKEGFRWQILRYCD